MLKDILQYVGEVVNIRGADSPEREQALRYINRAGRELYYGWDLPGSCFERYFTVNSTTQLITLPWYVEEIRGIRRATYASKIQLVDMSPRYHYRPWKQPTCQWRIMGESALATNLTQAGRLVITLAGAETDTLIVTIAGQTTTSGMCEEQVTFEPGVLTQTTVNQWSQDNPTGIRSISKSMTTRHDLTVTEEVGGAVVATIPNHLLLSKNKLLQVHDGNYSLVYSPNETVEILFKWPYKTLDSDYDLFVGTERFDDAIVWKVREHYHSTRLNEGELALAASAKCRDLMQKLCEDIEQAAEQTVMVAEDGVEFASQYNYRYSRYGQLQ